MFTNPVQSNTAILFNGVGGAIGASPIVELGGASASISGGVKYAIETTLAPAYETAAYFDFSGGMLLSAEPLKKAILSTQPFALELTFRHTVAQAATIIESNQFKVLLLANNTITVSYHVGGSLFTETDIPLGTIGLRKHVVIKRHTAGGNIKVYVDGVLRSTNTTTDAMALPSGGMSVGRVLATDTSRFSGFIYNLRLVVGKTLYADAPFTSPAITDYEATPVRGAIAPDAEVGLCLLPDFNSVADDFGPLSAAVTVSGVTQSTTVPMYGNLSLDFTATDSYLTVPDSARLDFASGYFLVNVTCRPNLTVGFSSSSVVSKGDATDGWGIYVNAHQFKAYITIAGVEYYTFVAHGAKADHTYDVSLQVSGRDVVLIVDGVSSVPLRLSADMVGTSTALYVGNDNGTYVGEPFPYVTDKGGYIGSVYVSSGSSTFLLHGWPFPHYDYTRDVEQYTYPEVSRRITPTAGRLIVGTAFGGKSVAWTENQDGFYSRESARAKYLDFASVQLSTANVDTVAADNSNVLLVRSANATPALTLYVPNVGTGAFPLVATSVNVSSGALELSFGEGYTLAFNDCQTVVSAHWDEYLHSGGLTVNGAALDIVHHNVASGFTVNGTPHFGLNSIGKLSTNRMWASYAANDDWDYYYIEIIDVAVDGTLTSLRFYNTGLATFGGVVVGAVRSVSASNNGKQLAVLFGNGTDFAILQDDGLGSYQNVREIVMPQSCNWVNNAGTSCAVGFPSFSYNNGVNGIGSVRSIFVNQYTTASGGVDEVLPNYAKTLALASPLYEHLDTSGSPEEGGYLLSIGSIFSASGNIQVGASELLVVDAIELLRDDVTTTAFDELPSAIFNAVNLVTQDSLVLSGPSFGDFAATLAQKVTASTLITSAELYLSTVQSMAIETVSLNEDSLSFATTQLISAVGDAGTVSFGLDTVQSMLAEVYDSATVALNAISALQAEGDAVGVAGELLLKTAQEIVGGTAEYYVAMLELFSEQELTADAVQVYVGVFASNLTQVMTATAGITRAARRALALQLHTGGFTSYTNYGFDRFFKVGKTHYGVAGGAVYALTGSVVSATVSSTKRTPNKGAMCNVQYVYTHGSVPAAMTCSVSTDAGTVQANAYYATPNGQTNRASFARGLRGVYWTYSMVMPANVSWQVDKVAYEATNGSRRVGK
jgi:hypothetical protein